MLRFPEIYDRIYQPGWSEAETRLAQTELMNLSDTEWHDWVEYRHQQHKLFRRRDD